MEEAMGTTVAVMMMVIIAMVGLLEETGAKVLIIQDQKMKMTDKQTMSTAMIEQMQEFSDSKSAEESKSQEFDQILIEGDSVLVGARNAFFNVSLITMLENKKVVWNSTANEVNQCRIKQKTTDECQNYIRVIVKVDADVYFVCGTNAYRPLCRTYRYETQTGDYSVIKEEIGIAHCPYGPSYNSTAIFAGEKMYSATAADVSSRDSLIYSRPLRTEQHDSQWLNDPQFVKSFEFGDKVFFFFREIAIEHINCGKTIFSRVARVCKSDTGGHRILRHTWTSFFKTRLNCSIPGRFPFYFDEIQSATDLGVGNVFPTLSRNDRTHMIYAIFSTPRNSIRGSAVCAYRMSDITKSFEGPFKEQRAPNANWLPVRSKDVPIPHPAAVCTNSSASSLGDHKLNFIKSHPMMDQAVGPFGGQPILVQTGFHFTLTQIAVDWQVYAADRRYYDVMFVGTDDGRIIKAVNRGSGFHQMETVVIEVMQVFEDNSAVRRLHIFQNSEHRKVVAVSATGVRSMPLHRCHLMKTCSSCVALRDPYCSWLKNRCTNSYMGYQSIDAGQHMRCFIENITKNGRNQTKAVLPNRCHSCNCWSSFTDEDGTMNMINNFPHSASALSHGSIHLFRDDGDDDDSTTLHVSGSCDPTEQWPEGGSDASYGVKTVAVTSAVCVVASLLVGCFTGYRLAACRHSVSRGVADKYSDVDKEFYHNNHSSKDSKSPAHSDTVWTNAFGNSGIKQLKMILNPYGRNTTISSEHSVSDIATGVRKV